jgi:uracil-DNA glycosylase
MELPHTFDDTLAALRDSLVQIARWGCRGFDCSADALTALDRWTRPMAPDTGPESLERVRADLGACRRCGLSDHRTRLVFGEGDPRARLVFVGEGPGLDEDRSGRPFVGAAGRLLTRIIEAMHLTREQVYICNVVKCRPPDNRNPGAEEIQACRPFLERQIAAIRPTVICTLGSVAARALLDTPLPVSRLRGRFHDRADIKVMPTYHPAYLLRNPDQKRVVWEDVKKIMALLRIPL